MDTLLRFGNGIVNVYMNGVDDRHLTLYADAHIEDGAFVPAQTTDLRRPTSEQIGALIDALVDMNTAIVAQAKKF